MVPIRLRAIRLVAFIALSLALLPAARADCKQWADAPRPSSQAVQAALRDAQDHGYLWRIHKEGRTSYLYRHDPRRATRIDVSRPARNAGPARVRRPCPGTRSA